MEKIIKAWYFSGTDKKLRYGDNRKIVIGRKHSVKGKIDLCENGLHGSKSILDALQYAPGPVVWQVELSGNMEKGSDKIAARHRKYIDGGIDISDTLREFARWSALQVLHLWDAPDVVKKYLETGNDELRAAARDAARDAARATAREAAWDAARAAAWDAARDAAWAAARAAAGDAAGAEQGKKLLDMVTKRLEAEL